MLDRRLLIALGNALLAASTTPRGFYLGLVVIVLGVGLLKPNVSAMVGELYPEGGARLDAGFTVFYMGINLGATLGPVVTGEAQSLIGPRAGFGGGGAFHGGGRAAVLLTQRHLGAAGRLARRDRARRKPWRMLWIALAVATLAARRLELRLAYRESRGPCAREHARDRRDGAAVLRLSCSSPAISPPRRSVTRW